MYFEDLSPYSRRLKHPIANAHNVGWLDVAHPFPKARTEPVLFEKLCDICAVSGSTDVHVNKRRSVQVCPLCGSDHFVIAGRDESLPIGMSELWIPNLEGGYFVAPSIVLHFIADHQYAPPRQFWDSVRGFDLSAPYVGQDAYLKSVAGAF